VREITEALNLAATTANVVGDVWRERLAAMTKERDAAQAAYEDCRGECNRAEAEIDALKEKGENLCCELGTALIRIREQTEEICGLRQENAIINEIYDKSVQLTASRCAEMVHTWDVGDCCGCHCDLIESAIRKEFNLN